jgi:transcriptional regulator with XRE-family HTH domain
LPSAATELGRRIAELRRRHFGAGGKEAFAARLGVPLDEYARYERGTLPSGALLVRMCELTGEDLQWLLTGVSSRGTIVISGARTRHEHLLTRLASALAENPELAAPVEAFLDLLLATPPAPASAELPSPDDASLIPIYDPADVPAQLPSAEASAGAPADGGRPSGGRRLVLPEGAAVAQAAFLLSEPASDYAAAEQRPVTTLTLDAAGAAQCFLRDATLARALPGVFGVRVRDTDMTPMFVPGDVVLVVGTAGARPGRPAVLKPADGPARCRIWLGPDGADVVLGRLSDHADERLPQIAVAWSLEVLYRMAPAA